MLVIAEWINDYLSEPLSVTQLTEALEAAGVEVEEVKHPPDFDDKITTAKVIEVKSHPDADKLQVAVVKAGRKQFEVVCGAPNLAEGQMVALAPPGASLPGGQEIAETEIRGFTSQGMLCSERELGLGDDHEGILDLGSEVDSGTALSNLYWREYTLIDVATAANRWDWQHYIGLAREVAAHSGVELSGNLEFKPRIKPKRVDDLFVNRETELVSCYGLVRLECTGLTPYEAPHYIKRRLRLQGIKPVNRVVDVTNYAMLVTGQPLHAFDVDKIQGMIEVRFARTDEKLETLDGVERSLSAEDLVIADENGPVALAGVMGGSRTEIDENTGEVIIEAATFSGTHVRKTAKRHGLRTEASQRFERQLPIPAVKRGLWYAVDMLMGASASQTVQYQHERTKWPWVQHIGLRCSQAQRISGLTDISRKDITDYLRRLQFDAGKFDIAAEARKLLNTPYKLGANFKEDGVDAFDCSYLTDYLYSLIGVSIGHTAHQQWQNGREASLDELQAGDLLFRGGPWVELDKQERDGVAHAAVYTGEDTIIEAVDYVRDESGEWQQLPEPERRVVESPLTNITGDPEFLGARRYTDGLDDFVRITVPWWRPDVTLPEDVIEEVVKLVGLDRIPATLPAWHPGTGVQSDARSRRTDEIRWLLYGLGLYEVVTYPFISETDIKLFRQSSPHWRLANPRSSEQACLRASLAPLLIKSVVNNTTYKDKFGIFEFARVFEPSMNDDLPSERLKLGIACKGGDVLELKACLDQITGHAHLSPTVDTDWSCSFLHSRRQAGLYVDGELLGWFGAVHPEVTSELKHADSQLLCAELDVDTLRRLWSEPEFTPLPKYPSSYRDVTLLVSPQVTWEQVRTVLDGMEEVEVSFRDEFFKDGMKAMTIHIELLARKRTLTEEDIQQHLQRLQDKLTHDLGAEIEL